MVVLAAGLLIVGAYLLGSFSSAVVVCHIMNLPDPRTQGSGNPGATNVLRHGGKKAALITLILDTLKGVIAVWIAGLVTDNSLILALVALAVFLGHLYPVFFQLRGGKGVATAFGILVTLVWQVGLSTLATWLFIAVWLRYSSVAAIIAALGNPLYMFLFSGKWEYIVMSSIISGLLIWRHRSNIRNLWRGEEDKIGAI